MKHFLVLMLVLSTTVTYSQNTGIPGAVQEVREMIQRKIEPPVSLLDTKKSAIVLVSVKLNKAGKYISSTMQYNEKSDVYANVRAVLLKVKASTWKRFKGVENILIPIYFTYDDGENDFCFDWEEVNPKKMKETYLQGIYLKPVIIVLAKQERMR